MQVAAGRGERRVEIGMRVEPEEEQRAAGGQRRRRPRRQSPRASEWSPPMMIGKPPSLRASSTRSMRISAQPTVSGRSCTTGLGQVTSRSSGRVRSPQSSTPWPSAETSWAIPATRYGSGPHQAARARFCPQSMGAPIRMVWAWICPFPTQAAETVTRAKAGTLARWKPSPRWQRIRGAVEDQPEGNPG